MGQNMSMGPMSNLGTVFRKKNRFMFVLLGISGISPDDDNNGLHCLPPKESARPHLSFKEQEVHHLSESIWYPTKPDWKPMNLKLYHINCKDKNPVMEWINQWYTVKSSGSTSEDDGWQPSSRWSEEGLKKDAKLKIYDGCGEVIESWLYENCYPNDIQFGELEMGSNDILTIDIVLRYDRASVLPNN